VDLNPYDELGVDRDADEPTIRKAYRDRAKSAHPNAGGDPAEWERVSTALTVLVDPKKRKTFDDTGRIEEDRPDNDRSSALQIIEAQMGTIINAYIGSGFDPARDPRRADVVAKIISNVEGEIAQQQDGILGGEDVIAFMEDMRDRFEMTKPSENPIVRSLDRQIGMARQQISDLEAAIRVRQLVIEIVGGYEFRADPPPAYTAPSRTGYGFTHVDMRPDGSMVFGR